MLPQLIIDLALILGLAAVTTLVCRWLKQPVVLGYILAGYLAGNHFGLLPDVEDTKNLHTLAELGIIFLLFGLGLEFSFKKLLEVGTVAITTALVIISGMMLLGFECGRMLGWATTDSVFLAAMLSMSSTTIIIKALGDLGLKSKKFASVVFGILIVEDLFAIIMLVILSTIYVGQQSSSAGQITWGVVKLLFFLVSWIGIGLYLVPLILERAKRWLTREILLLVSLGMCLGMVWLANFVGFSSALGAFIMGSIFAETVEIKEIEKITAPIRDLFGAVFFVSVGMMVDPVVLGDYWWPVLLLTLVVVVGQMVFSIVGMLIAGQRLDIAVQGGFSLVQIGEFAFIIASLGTTLGVTSGFLYPVAVGVSVITTFLTPFIIKLSPSAIRLLQRLLPDKLQKRIEANATSNTITVTGKSLWRQYIVAYISNMSFFLILLSGAIWLIHSYIFPLIRTYSSHFGIHLAVATLSIMLVSPLLWGLAIRNVKPAVFKELWRRHRLSRSLIVLLYLVRVLFSLGSIVVLLRGLYDVERSLILGVLLTTLIMILFSSRITSLWKHWRGRLRYNLRDKSGINSLDDRLADMHVTEASLSGDSLFVGRTIGDLQLRQMYGVSVISIRRGSRDIVVPQSSEILMPMDMLSIVGRDEDLRRFQKFAHESLPTRPPANMIIHQWWIKADSGIVGRTVTTSMIREIYGCLVVALCRSGGEEEKINPRTEFRAGDIVWLAGERSRIGEVLEKYQ